MKKNSVIIIDDLHGAREDARAVLEETSVFDVCEVFASVRDAEAFFLKGGKNVTLILCDIEMPELSGLEAVQMLKNYCTYFVLITGFAQKYALAGHDSYVDGYLTKPLAEEKVLQLFRNLREKERKRRLNDLTAQKILLDFVPSDSPLQHAKKGMGRVKKSKNNTREYQKVPVDIDTIVYMETMYNYLHFYGLKNGEIYLLGVLNWTLKDFEHVYATWPNFVRADASRIVNTHFITKVSLDRMTIGDAKSISFVKTREQPLKNYLNSIDPKRS